MSNVPEISIIVPVYKVEEYLSQCIDSILVQTFTNFELLLVDDGSPDRCGEMCEEYAQKDERIRVFHQENAGVSTARNKGLAEAYGKYIVFVDSDDYILPAYLEDLYNELSEHKGSGVVIESVIKLYPNGVMQPSVFPNLDFSSEDRFRVLTDLVDKNIGYPHSKIYSRDIIKKYSLSFLSSISLLEDFFFLFDYIQYADFILIRNISNYIYRVEYSDTALSVCNKSLKEECEIFQNYYYRVILYQQEYNLKADDLQLVWKELKIFFHRILLSLYVSLPKESYKLRKTFLKSLVLTYSDWIKYCFRPDYLSDRIARFLLLNRCYLFFDLWMRGLLKIQFVYMFGSKRK